MLRLLLASTMFTLWAALPHARAAGGEQLEANKKTVTAFEDAALNRKDFEAAAKYLGPRYTQHNPNAGDGPEGLKAYLAFLKEKFPASRSEIKHIFAGVLPFVFTDILRLVILIAFPIIALWLPRLM